MSKRILTAEEERGLLKKRKARKRNVSFEEIQEAKSKPPRREPRGGSLVGLRYCGPGNDVGREDDPAPVSKGDALCREHDIGYGKYKRPYAKYNAADEKFVQEYFKEADKGNLDGTWGQKIALRLGIGFFQLKKKFYEKGLIGYEKLKEELGSHPEVLNHNSKSFEELKAREEDPEFVDDGHLNVPGVRRGVLQSSKRRGDMRSRSRSVHSKVPFKRRRVSSKSYGKKGKKRASKAGKRFKVGKGSSSVTALKKAVRKLRFEKNQLRYITLQGQMAANFRDNAYLNKKCFLDINVFHLISDAGPPIVDTSADYSFGTSVSIYDHRARNYPVGRNCLSYPEAIDTSVEARWLLKSIYNKAEMYFVVSVDTYVTIWEIHCIRPCDSHPLDVMLSPVQVVKQVNDTLANQATLASGYTGYSDLSYDPFKHNAFAHFFKVVRTTKKTLRIGDNMVKYSWRRKYFNYMQNRYDDSFAKPGDVFNIMEWHGQKAHDDSVASLAATVPCMVTGTRIAKATLVVEPYKIANQYVEEDVRGVATSIAALENVDYERKELGIET